MRYRGTLDEDQLLRLIIDVPASEPADEFFRNYKGVLKSRFEKMDIWSACKLARLCDIYRPQYFLS